MSLCLRGEFCRSFAFSLFRVFAAKCRNRCIGAAVIGYLRGQILEMDEHGVLLDVNVYMFFPG